MMLMFKERTARALAVIAVLAAALGALLVAGSSLAAAPRTTSVLVHGAFADGSSWDRVVPLLQAKGMKVVSVQLPLTSLADDVAATRRALDAQTGPVVLVGHSWGGVVITEAGAHERVKALVYVAAFAPAEGQAVAALGQGWPTPPGAAFLVQDASGFVRLSDEGVARHFAQDLPARQTALLAVSQGPINASSFAEVASVAAWRTKPSWFVLTERDHMIDPGLQAAMAQTIGARKVTVRSSHAVALSHPSVVADAIAAAAAAAAAGSDGDAGR